MLLGKRVVAVDPAAHSVTTDSGETIGYGKLVWATGGRPRMLPIPGGDLPGVQGVRTRADADAMKAASETAGQIERRSEEHTSELQSLMRISYAVFCLKKKITTNNTSKNRAQRTRPMNTKFSTIKTETKHQYS